MLSAKMRMFTGCFAQMACSTLTLPMTWRQIYLCCLPGCEAQSKVAYMKASCFLKSMIQRKKVIIGGVCVKLSKQRTMAEMMNCEHTSVLCQATPYILQPLK